MMRPQIISYIKGGEFYFATVEENYVAIDNKSMEMIE